MRRGDHAFQHFFLFLIYLYFVIAWALAGLRATSADMAFSLACALRRRAMQRYSDDVANIAVQPGRRCRCIATVLLRKHQLLCRAASMGGADLRFAVIRQASVLSVGAICLTGFDFPRLSPSLFILKPGGLGAMYCAAFLWQR